MWTNLSDNYIGDRPGLGRCIGNYRRIDNVWQRIVYLSLNDYQSSQNCIRSNMAKKDYRYKRIYMSCIGRIV